MFKNIIKKAESIGWSVQQDGNYICFENWTSAGQNIIFENKFKSEEELIESLKDRSIYFDVSEEASYWIDSTGHGVNGAPYELKNIIKDMEEAKKMYKELYEAIK